MYCDECKQRPATVHIAQVTNGVKVERHLCEECSAKVQTGSMKLDVGLTLSKLLGSFFGGTSAPATGDLKTCPGCGMTFQQVRQKGRLGCGRCYETFEEEIEPILRRIHGNSRHVGRVPVRSGERYLLLQRIDALKQQLQAAVQAEEYERAADLRDRLKELERERDARFEGGQAQP